MRILLRRAGEYALCAILSIALLAWLFDLPHRDLGIPLADRDDALYGLTYCKCIIDHGWPLTNPDLGAPHGATAHDYQHNSTLHFVYLKLLGFLIHNPFVLANVYFLCTFPLTALIALAVLRHFRLSYWPALTASLLYAFLPYHSHRNLSHLFLAAYFFLPLGAAVVLWVFRDEPLFTRRRCTARGIASLVIAVVIASSEVYYAFFTCFFLLTAGFAARWRMGRWKPSGSALLLIGVMATTTLVNLLPQFAYRFEHGRNMEACGRATSDAEHHALRVSQMLMPTSSHRVPLLNFAKQRFNAKLIQVTESDMASLGLLGSAGLLYLLALLLVRPKETSEAADSSRQGVLHALSVLTLAGILVGSVGGFSLLVASVFPYIRCYNRISVYIAFFALFALAHLLEQLARRLPARPAWQAITAVVCLSLAVVGAWEQTPTTVAPQPGQSVAFMSDRDLVRRLEERVPQGAAIFQLPYTPYPEGRNYDHLRIYLHSHSTKWSFGAMRGRYADLWQRHVVGQPVEEMAATLAWAGFAGVCWDRHFSTPAEHAAEERWRALLGEPTLLSQDGRLAFYSLQQHAARLRSGVSPEQARKHQEEALHPVLVCWNRGFQQLENPDQCCGRWSNRRSELVFLNPSDTPQQVRLGIEVRTAQAGEATLRLRAPDFQQDTPIHGLPRSMQMRLVVPPGRSCLCFDCDGAADPQHERRVFQVVSYTIRVASDAAARTGITRSPH